MRVDNHIRYNAIHCEWEIFLSKGHSTCSLLTMSTCKLISNLRDSHTPDSHFGKLITCCILWNYHHINNTLFSSSRSQRRIFVLPLTFQSTSIGIWRNQYFSNQALFIFNSLSWRNHTITVQFHHSFIKDFTIFGIWFTYFGHRSIGWSNVLFRLISSIKHTSEHPPFNSRLINDNTILLVITCKTSHCYNHITPYWHLLYWNIFCWLSND